MIEIQDIKRTAKLASIQLTEEEESKFSKQLSDVLKFIQQMNEVDTTGVEPMVNTVHFSNVMREDVEIYESTREELMQNAPEREGDFFKVPKIGN